MPDQPELPLATMWVEPWPDAVIDKVGHDPRSDYVERYWLGVLGPSATWLIRRLADGLEAQPDGFELDLAATASELGLGVRAGRHAPFMRTIERCARFGALDLTGTSTMRVRRKLPPLTRYQHERLPDHLRHAHQALLDRAVGPRSADEHREHVRGMALSFARRGMDALGVERALHAHGVHPALAHEVAHWSVERVAATAADPLPPAA